MEAAAIWQLGHETCCMGLVSNKRTMLGSEGLGIQASAIGLRLRSSDGTEVGGVGEGGENVAHT